MDIKKKGLGRGLGALIRETAPAAPRPAERMLDVDAIRPNTYQPRRHFDEAAIAEMTESIREQGVVQPLLVRRKDDGYELVAGERRLRAARAAGLTSVPVVVREMSDRDALEIALVENLQREDLSPLEEAAAFRKLVAEFGLTQEEVAKRVGKSRPAVANTIRLLDLPEAVLDELRAGRLSAGHARALLTLRDAARQIALAKEAVRLRLNVRQLEARVAAPATSPPDSARVVAPEVADVERHLMRALGTKVRIRSSGKRGKIIIEFHSLDEFDRISGIIRGSSRL